MVVVAGHLLAMRRAKHLIPSSRYRIRSVNGGMMLALVPLLACAFSVVSPADQKLFALIWMTCVGLLGVVVVLACVDGINNIRLGRLEAMRLIGEHRDLMAEAASELRQAREARTRDAGTGQADRDG